MKANFTKRTLRCWKKPNPSLNRQTIINFQAGVYIVDYNLIIFPPKKIFPPCTDFFLFKSNREKACFKLAGKKIKPSLPCHFPFPSPRGEKHAFLFARKENQIFPPLTLSFSLLPLPFLPLHPCFQAMNTKGSCSYVKMIVLSICISKYIFPLCILN